ncbi:MAG: FkbM family methyltransferase, partial [Chlamydiales bacterium]|nr:FkbM family methyltransferase [Chlamydiales bacterium]
EEDFQDLPEYKQQFLGRIFTDPSRLADRSYPFDRVLKTIRADDVDEIPKETGAGKVFEEGGVRYQLMHNGVKVIEHSYYAAWMTDVIEGLKGHHEPQEEKAFYQVLRHIPAGGTIVELGSYWCYYSLWFLKAVPDAAAWLIEPIPSSMELGKRHFMLNGQQGHFTLGYIPMDVNDTWNFPNARRIEIDRFLQENHIEHVDILHSDIQGAEYHMLLSCRESLKNQIIDYFFVSTHSDQIHQMCRDWLLSYGYCILAEHTMGESCSVDGLIVAKSPKIAFPDKIEIKKYPDSL